MAAAVLVVLLTAGGVAWAGLNEIGRLQQLIPAENIIAGDVAVDAPEAGKPQTLMALGTDGRLGADAGDGQRSDTILLARLNPRNRAITMTSIPRDLKVEIPGYGTDKINAAYSLGGTKLTIKTVKALMSTPGHPFKINHVVEVNFTGFRDLVDYLGCVYVDVDRHYFNDVGGPLGYATIDVPEGYGRLCGNDALDYVRYRHTDSDLVRGARQQDFIRQMLRQPGIRTRLTFSKRTDLVKLAGRYTRTDKGLARSAKQLITLLKLGLSVASEPVEQIPFGGDELGYTMENGISYLNAPPEAVADTVRRFMEPPAPKPPKKQLERRPKLSGLTDTRAQGEAVVAQTPANPGMPLYFPSLGLEGSVYAAPQPRVYELRGRPAYRLSIRVDGKVGAYYGVQGMKWRNPPILDGPHRDVTVAGRRLAVYLDGSKVSMVAWRTPKAVYWVHNTLTHDLTRPQMLAIARSLVARPG